MAGNDVEFAYEGEVDWSDLDVMMQSNSPD